LCVTHFDEASSSNLNGHALLLVLGERQRSRSRSRTRADAADNNTKDDQGFVCHNCGKEGHIRRECPDWGWPNVKRGYRRGGNYSQEHSGKSNKGRGEHSDKHFKGHGKHSGKQFKGYGKHKGKSNKDFGKATGEDKLVPEEIGFNGEPLSD
jgi:hypothetical protein